MLRSLSVSLAPLVVAIIFAGLSNIEMLGAEPVSLKGVARYKLSTPATQATTEGSVAAPDVIVELRELKSASPGSDTISAVEIADTTTDADGSFVLYLTDLNAESSYEMCARSLYGYEGAISLGYGKTASQWKTDIAIVMRPSGEPNCNGQVVDRPPVLLLDSHRPVKSVFFATDRAVTDEASGGSVTNSNSANGEVSYGRCDAILDVREGDPKDFISLSTSLFKSRNTPSIARLKMIPPEQAWKTFSNEVNSRGDKDALLFIHGYNTSFNEACRRAAQLAFELKFEGTIFLYSWPSHDSLLAYAADEEMTQWAGPHFLVFLKSLLNMRGVGRIHIIAHSMGNRLLYSALESQQLTSRERSHIGELVLAAPDINRLIFDQGRDLSSINALRVTLYASSRDQALLASKIFHGYTRLGDSRPEIDVKPWMDSVDASLVDTSLLGHSYFGDSRSVLSDISALIQDDKEPGRRFGLRKEGTIARQWWVITP